MSEFTRYSVVTPNLPDATCFIADRLLSPLLSVEKRSTSSPPSPVFDFPSILFMAMARFSCASADIDPYDMAPVANRFTISVAGSTSSILILFLPVSLESLSLNKPLIVNNLSSCSSMDLEYSLNVSKELLLTAC